MDLCQVAVDGQVLSCQLLDDLVLALDVLAQAVVFVLDGGLLFENFDEFLLNYFLLLEHLSVCGIHLFLHLFVVLSAELELLFELEDVA